jgi:DeoR family suf operon transcriptional repressor
VTASQPSEPVELAPVETAGQDVALAHLSEARQAVIRALKQLGESSIDELAAILGVTVAAARQQLTPLEDSGLVAHRDVRQARGRPRRWYCLAPSAEALFPKRYGQLTNQLLGFVEERAAERLEGRGFDERVRELTAILDDDGYLADCEQLGAGHWRVVEHNCAILDVAQRYEQACQSELEFLREALPAATVERVAHRIGGGHVCAYDIRRVASGAGQTG